MRTTDNCHSPAKVEQQRRNKLLFYKEQKYPKPTNTPLFFSFSFSDEKFTTSC
jgi:hypothetical protein